MGLELQNQPWFLQALRDEHDFSGRMHPQNLAELYLLSDEAREGALPIRVTRRSERFAAASLSELMALESQMRRQNAAATWANIPMEAQMSAVITNVVKDGKAMSQSQRDSSLSKTGRMRDIRSNKTEELDQMGVDAVGAVFKSTTPAITEANYTEVSAVEQKTRLLVESLMEQKGP
jgi:hypothetical protein